MPKTPQIFMKDIVRPLKIESPENGGTEIDFGPTEVTISEDYLASKGISFEGSEIETFDLSLDGNIQSPALETITLNKKVIDELKSYKIPTNNQYVIYECVTLDGHLVIDGDFVVFN